MKKHHQASQSFAFIALAGLALAATPARGANSLRHYWKLDGNASDFVTGGAHPGTAQGAASYTTGNGGKFGEAVNLNSGNDGITTGAASLPASNFTLTAWVKPDSHAAQSYVAGTQVSGSSGAFIRIDNGVPFARTNGTAAIVSGGSAPVATWTHLAITVDSSTGLTLFVNGAPVANNPAGTSATVASNFTIGRRPDGTGSTSYPYLGFDGLIDDVAVFNGVLDSTQLGKLISDGAEFGDDGPPQLLERNPVNGALDALPPTTLTLGFDENVRLGSGLIGIFLADGTPVQSIDVNGGTVTIEGARVSIPIVNLALGTAYYVSIANGAFTDLSGNPYAGISGTSAWAFTTATDTLIHHWEFEGSANDSAGTHHGTLAGDATYAAGWIGQAASFDGNGDSIAVNQSSLPATDFTLAAWIKPGSTGGTNYVAGTQNSGSAGAFLRVDDGSVFVNLLPPADSKRATGGAVPVGAWTHVTATVSSSTGLTIYVNGQAVASDPTATGHNPWNNFRIGARPDGETFGFNGLIDDLRIYGAALSASEVAALAGTAPFVLKISQTGGGLAFEWESLPGMQYDLLSATELTIPVSSWPAYNDGVNTYENIPASGTGVNTLTGVLPNGPVRFFALREKSGQAE